MRSSSKGSFGSCSVAGWRLTFLSIIIRKMTIPARVDESTPSISRWSTRKSRRDAIVLYAHSTIKILCGRSVHSLQ